MSTIFGPELERVTLKDIQAYLDDADDEPLIWEAKGTALDKGVIRAQVCGFANGEEAGYLILGASKEGDAWVCRGVGFPEVEPTIWLTNVITDDHRGVRPRPEIAFSRALPSVDGHVVVVRVAPSSTPPCLANGTVYERLPGKTVPVRDPQRLAALYTKGEQARLAARSNVDRATAGVFDELLAREAQELVQGSEDTWFDAPRYALGIGATGNPPSIARRLFQNSMAEDLWSELGASEPGMPPGFGPQVDPVSWFQDSLIWRAVKRYPVEATTILRVSWEGVVTFGRVYTPGVLRVESIGREVQSAWERADAILGERLLAYGDIYLMLIVGGHRLGGRRGVDRVVMRRGPLMPGVHAEEVAGLGRELSRAVGNPEPEPEQEPSSEPGTAPEPGSGDEA